MLLVVVIKGSVEAVTALGPTFSNQVWSTIWLAIVWPRIRPIFEGRR